MAGRKARLAPDDVNRMFDDACIEELAGIGKLPAGADRKRFAEGIRLAARMYATESRIPNVNALNDEIAELHRAADRCRYDEVACLLEQISARARDMLTERGGRPSIGIKLPTPDTLRDGARRESACADVARLCRIGGRVVESRRRATGKRSRKVWRAVLYAPKKQRNFDRRAAERDFVMWLRVTWVEAVGQTPSQTARHADASRRPGPFARMVQECLRLVGAPDADAVGLINELHRRRRLMERRPPLDSTRE